MNEFYRAEANEFDAIFESIGRDWMLITASDGARANTMTASWGCCGVLWNKPVAVCFIRPTRHTFAFTEKSDRYSLAFFDGGEREALALCGRMSGRDGDKFQAAGLTCAYTEDGVPYPAEASRVLICRKLYADMLRPEAVLDKELLSHYAKNDYHKVYVGEIEQVLLKNKA